MIAETPRWWDKLAAVWFEIVSWVIKPFTRCGNDDRCIFISADFPRHNDGQWELVLWDTTPINVYYCPWCGRKMKQAAAETAGERVGPNS